MPKFPLSKINIKEIWEYPERTLSNQDEVISQIWSYTNRTLTEIKGQPRIDLLGEDRDYESGLGYRKAAIDKIHIQEDPIEGTFTANNEDRPIIQIELGKPFMISAYIDLSNMTDEDEITIRQYIKIQQTGNYILYAEKPYIGAQRIKLLHIMTKPAKYGLKITLQQHNTDYKQFPYQAFVVAIK